VDVLPSDLLDPPQREIVRRRLAAFVALTLEARLAPLHRLRSAPLAGGARGLAFSIAGALGSVPRRGVSSLVRDLSATDRRALESLGVWFGQHHVFLADLFDRESVRLRALLFTLQRGGEAPRPEGRPSVPADRRVSREAWAACGYEPLGSTAVRVDRLERLIAAAHRRGRRGAFVPDAEMRSLLDGGAEAVAEVLRAVGFRSGDGGRIEPPARTRARAGSRNG